MADLNRITAANKVQRILPGAPPAWSAECDRLLRALGDDAAALEKCEHALAAVAAGSVDAAALTPAVAALARHCKTASPDEQSSRFANAASRLSYLHTNAEQKDAHRIASQRADEISELCRAVTVSLAVEDYSDAEEDAIVAVQEDSDAASDDAIVALSGTVGGGIESDDDSVQMIDAPAADDSEALARRLAAEDRAAARMRRRSEEADAALARQLASADRIAGADASVIDVDQIDDAELTRRLSVETAPIAPVPAKTPAKLPANSIALVTPTASVTVRHLRIRIPGGSALDLRDLPADKHIGVVFEPLRLRLGLAPDDDLMSAFVLVRLAKGAFWQGQRGGRLGDGDVRYTRPDLRTVTVGEATSSEHRTRFRI